MNRTSIPYTNYSYSPSWGYAGYSSSYYGYQSPPNARRNSLPPSLQNGESKQETSDQENTSRSKCLIVTVVILVILLIAAIIALVFLVRLYQDKKVPTGESSATGETSSTDSSTTASTTTTTTTTTSTTTTTTTTTTTPTTTTTTIPPPTVIGFNVTHVILAYSQDMANRYSAVFNNTDYTFCYMIENDWLGNKYPDCCQCIEFKSGSVIATVHLTFDSSLGKPDDLLNEMKGVIPASSAADERTNRVQPTDIVFV